MSKAAIGAERITDLRSRLVDDLVAAGSITSPRVEEAFRVVPRHAFAPEVSPRDAYANDIVRVKCDERGITTSSVSAPWLQATMVEQADIEPGMRCLKIGSGGYNAALIAELVGANGAVTSVDIDPDVTARARRLLDSADYERVRVVLADAEHGVPAHAPYDRIIVTAGVWDIPPAWLEQLAPNGRIVVPLRLRGLSRSIALIRRGDHLESLGHEMAGFVDVQGVGAHPERLVPLHGEDVGLRFDDDPGVDQSATMVAIGVPRNQGMDWSRVAVCQ